MGGGRAEPFRTRRYVAVAPHLRPWKSRRAVRVVVTDGEAALMFADTDPGTPGSRWWVTPGGGVDPGESDVEAALRELHEETGWRAAAGDLVGPVMRRVVVHGYSDQVCEQSEVFFVLRTPRFTPDLSRHTSDEQLTLSGHAWLDLGALHRVREPVWPGVLDRLVALSRHPDRWPWDMGVVEESTVPVGAERGTPDAPARGWGAPDAPAR